MARKDATLPVTRRDFLRTAGGAAAAGLVGFPGFLTTPRPASPSVLTPGSWGGSAGNLLRLPTEAFPDGLTLTAQPGMADVGGGLMADAWMLNDCLPSPLLRTRRGERFRVTLNNRLKDPLILHWHGLTPPQESDGHPRFAVGTGQSYAYDFTVENRASTYWYHSHAHLRVGEHTYRGIGGMIIVEDDEEQALGLPSGAREIPIILQDRNVDAEGRPAFTRTDSHMMVGYMGPEPFGNGIHQPRLDLDSALYRFRILNGSNARIFQLERSDGRPLVMIGNDGGLLERPQTIPYLEIAPAERADLLVDLSDLRAGEEVTLRSRPFTLPSKVSRIGAEFQGAPIELLRLRVVREVREEPLRLPERLSSVPLPDPAQAKGERTFRFTSERDYASRSLMQHRINGHEFMNPLSADMPVGGVAAMMTMLHEAPIPFNQTQIWTLENESDFAHPIHVHATHFRVLSREGGRGRVFPWESGLKDTVLLYPYEKVRIAIRFTSYPGLYLIHCHNLEHEDSGMMANILVE